MALLTASLVAPTLFAQAADSAALDTGLAAVADDAFSTTTADARATWDSVLDEDSYVVVRRKLAGLPSYAPPVVNAVGGGTSARGINPVVLRGGKAETAALYYRDGAVAALGGTPHSRGVWLPDEVAAALDVHAGDYVSVGLQRSFGPSITAPTLVAGTFSRARLSALPEQLAGAPGLSARDLPYDPDNPGAGRPIMIADRDTFERLSIALGYPPLWTADMRLDPDVTPDEARAASAAVQKLATDAFDDRTRLAQASYRAKPAPTRVAVTSGLPDIVAEADSTATAARDQAAPFAQAGIVLAVVVMCAATVLLGRSRRREQDLLSGLGVRPHETLFQNKPGQHANGEGAAAEAKSKNLVVFGDDALALVFGLGFVIPAQEFVETQNVAVEAEPERAAEDRRRLERRCADAVVVNRNLIRLRQVDGLERAPDVGPPDLGG